MPKINAFKVALEKTLESSLDCKEIQPQSILKDWIFTQRTEAEADTPTLWPPHEKSQLIRKTPAAGKD